MDPSVTPPTKEEVRPPGLAMWMVKKSLPYKVREEGLAAFEEEFAEELKISGDLREARMIAYRNGWDSFQRAYKPIFDISMYVLAIAGFLLGLASIF